MLALKFLPRLFYIVEKMVFWEGAGWGGLIVNFRQFKGEKVCCIYPPTLLQACAPSLTIGSLSQASFKGVCYMSFNNSLRTFSKITPCGPKAPNSLSYYDDMFCFAGVNLAVKVSSN